MFPTPPLEGWRLNPSWGGEEGKHSPGASWLFLGAQSGGMGVSGSTEPSAPLFSVMDHHSQLWLSAEEG